MGLAREPQHALGLARALIEVRLSACVNVIPGRRSFYRWQDEVQDDREVVVIAKTRESLVGAHLAKVKELHSDDCACVVALPIHAGNSAFLDWNTAETEPC